MAVTWSDEAHRFVPTVAFFDPNVESQESGCRPLPSHWAGRLLLPNLAGEGVSGIINGGGKPNDMHLGDATTKEHNSNTYRQAPGASTA